MYFDAASQYLRRQMRALQKNIEFIVEQYKGDVPLTHFLKAYFKAHPVLGSRDRKIIADAVYSYYRCALFLDDTLTLWEQVLVSLTLAENGNPHTLKLLPGALQQLQSADTDNKTEALLQMGYLSAGNIKRLEASSSLSDGITASEWHRSLWQKPRVFFSVTKGKEQKVVALLKKAEIVFREEGNNCFSCNANTAIEKILAPGDYRVQDFSSQNTAAYFALSPGCSVWDCCSGAGGKSLLASDSEPSIRLTVSDIRSSILHNLKERFRLYKKTLPEQLLLSAADAAALETTLGNRTFDQIIADVPCTGSGTWARTPEQFYFFDTAQIRAFSERQSQILNNISRYVKPGGHITYITCSVFRDENESVLASFLENNNRYELLQSGILNGISRKADNMFAALIRRKA